ncbi:MAG: hypothetical protein CNE97_03810 [alpha proteobacterium MED-G10]|nr:MAG: hypothetical protein CNE97_03810 [alpha proteobacterium MED-G10]
MKIKYLKNLSFFFSIFFLSILTILFIFTIFISIKPIKLNFTNYFDRESKIFKKIDVTEIGDIFLSFNRTSKNFEMIIEDVLIDQSYFRSTLIALDLTFSERVFNTSLKVFDADIFFYKEMNSYSNNLNEIRKKRNIFEQYSFINFFDEIEVINSKIQISNKSNVNLRYAFDLSIKNEKVFLLLNEIENTQNYVSINFSPEKEYSLELDAKNFKVDFLKLFFVNDIFELDDLIISGKSEINLYENMKLKSFSSNLNINGTLNQNTNFGVKKILFKNNPFSGRFDNQEISASLKFMNDNSRISIGLRTGLEEKKPKFFFRIDQISVENLLKIWPKNLMDSTFWWMEENSAGILKDVLLETDLDFSSGKINVGDVKGSFICNDINIKYMDSMPTVKRINGFAKINNSSVIFEINSGSSNDLEISNGIIKLYDLNTNVEKANINLDISSKNKSVVDYLNLTEINKDNYKKLNEISGNVNFNLILDFPLLFDLDAEQIEYSADAKLTDGYYKLIDPDYVINNLNMNINVGANLVNFSGKGVFFNSNIEFTGDQITRNNNIVDEIKGRLLLDSYQLLNFIPEFFEETSGSIPINFSYTKGKKDFKFEGVGETDQLKINSEFLGKDLSFQNGKIRFVISPYNEKLSGFLDIKTKNIDIEVNSIFSNLKLFNLEILKFKSPNQNFQFSVNNETILDVNLNGKKVSIEKMNLNEESTFSNLENIVFNLQADRLYIGNNIFIDSSINFKKNNNRFDFFNAYFKGDKDYHNINLSSSHGKKKFYLESNFVPGLLNIFDINLKINTGSLKIEGEQSSDLKTYDGKIVGKDFVFLDTPFLADFITLFSLQGLAQKLKDGGIIFESLNGKYVLSEDKLRIVDSLLKGSELGIQFDSVIGLEDDYFLTTGSVIPAYTINTLLTKFPIVGDIITAGSPEDGLIGAKFEVEKEDDEYKISYNPISVFVPNLIKNFLGN